MLTLVKTLSGWHLGAETYVHACMLLCFECTPCSSRLCSVITQDFNLMSNFEGKANYVNWKISLKLLVPYVTLSFCAAIREVFFFNPKFSLCPNWVGQGGGVGGSNRTKLLI